jgi:hypothetical protein
MKPRSTLCYRLFCGILLSLSLMAGAGHGQESEGARKIAMELVWIRESKSQIFVVDGMGFYSANSLQEYLGKQPAGTIVEWDPGCLRMGNEPLLSSENDMNEFKTYLKERDIEFVLVPSG